MKKTQTLLEKAFAVPTRMTLNYSHEEVDVALAWMTKRLTLKQVQVALNQGTIKSSGGNTLYRVAVLLRHAASIGRIKVI